MEIARGALVQTCEQFGRVQAGTVGVVDWADNVRGHGAVAFHKHGLVHMVPLHLLCVIPAQHRLLTECESGATVDLPLLPER